MFVFFVLLLLVLGGWFMWEGATDPSIASESLGIPVFAGGLIFVYAGLLLAVSFVRVHKWGLLVMAPLAKLKRRGYSATLIPRWDVVGFGKMSKVSLQMVSVGRGSAPAMIITRKDGRSQAINIGPYTRRDCRKLVLFMRARGVDVHVQPALLGRGFN